MLLLKAKIQPWLWGKAQQYNFQKSFQLISLVYEQSLLKGVQKQ